MALHVDPNSSLGGCILTKRGGVSAGEAVASAAHPETSAHIAAVGGPALCPVCDMNKGRPPRRVPQGQRGAGSPGITPPENHRGGRAAPAGQQRPARRGYSTAAVFPPSSDFFTVEGERQQR